MIPPSAAFEPIRTIAHDPAFWTDFFFLTHSNRDYAEIRNYDQVVPPDDFNKTEGFTLECCCLTFPVAHQRGLILDFTCDLTYFGLDLLQADGKRVQFGWDDEAHWHPHVFRWEELDLICKCLSVSGASFAYPGLPLLLLCRFAPITDSDNAQNISSLLRDACRSVGVDSLDTSESVFKRLDKRRNGFEWKYDLGSGWTLHQENPLTPNHENPYRYKVHLYTLRSPKNDAFPFTEFNAILGSARRICEGVSSG